MPLHMLKGENYRKRGRGERKEGRRREGGGKRERQKDIYMFIHYRLSMGQYTRNETTFKDGN